MDVTMTNLDMIPNPADCHRVPVGAVVPARTPFWRMRKNGNIEWCADGSARDKLMQDGDDAMLTVTRYPVNGFPQPTEALIMIDRAIVNGSERVNGKLAAYSAKIGKWLVVGGGDDAPFVWTSQIVEWRPVVTVVSGHGVWDETDKRDRVDKFGTCVRWVPATNVWEIKADLTRVFGSLHAMREIYDDDYLIGFAEDE